MAKYMPVGGRISANKVINKAVSAVPKNIGPTIANKPEVNKTVEYKSPLAEWSKNLKASQKVDTSPRNYGRTNTNRLHLGLYDDEKTPDMTLSDYTYKPLLSGYYNQRMNEAIGKNRLSGNMDFDTPEIVKYQSLYEKSQPNQFDNPKAPFAGLLNKGIQGAMGLAGQRIADLTDEDTVTYAGVGAATGAMAGSVAPLAGNVIGAGTGFSAGIATGVGKNMFESMFGSTYKGLVDAGVSDNTAYKTALMSAGMQSALEMAQVDELVKATKLLKKQGKTVLADGIEKMLLDRGKSIFTNSAEEVAQESVAMAGEYYAKSKEDIQTDSWEDNVRRAGQTALESAISFGIFSLPGTISTGAQIYNHNNHINKQNTANDVMNEGSKINAKEFVSEFKSPQEFQGWAERFANKANVDIEFVADENTSFNGYFSSYNESKNGRAGKIVVNINGKDPINTVFAHELTHALEINEAEYNDYANFAINNILSEHYGTNDITHLAELKASFYSQKGVNIDMDSAKREIVAELTSEYVLKDEKAIESLFRYNESLFYRIFENIKSMIKRFTGTKEERNLIRARDLYAKILKANGKSHVITSDDIQTETQENRAASYLFAGEKASNSNKKSLDKAKKMEFEGVDSEIIWKETGWFRGPDKKWRWEIDDSKGKYNNDFEDISANDNKFSLENHYENQELYDAYPDLRKTGYETADIGRVDGMYNPKSDNLIVSDKYKKNKDDKGAEETIIHEIQHIIQNKEGFSKGGNAESALKLIRKSAQMNLAEIGDEKFIELIADGTINQIDEYVDNFLMEMYNVDNIEDVGFKVYESLQGEVEARIASKRMNMSSDERREKMPSFGNSLMLEELEDDKTFNKALSTQNKSPDNVQDIDDKGKPRYKENEKRTSGNMVAGSEEAAFSMQNRWDIEKNNENNINSFNESEKKFSLKRDDEGVYVEIDTDQDVFDGVEIKDMSKVAQEYMNNKFKDLILEGILIDSKGIKKITHPGVRQPFFVQKMRSTTELDNIINASIFIDSKQATKDSAKYPKFEYYGFNFKLKDKWFSGILNIGVDVNGQRHLYEINRIRQSRRPYEGITPQERIKATLTDSNNNIPTKDKDVNNVNIKSIEKEDEKKFSLSKKAFGDLARSLKREYGSKYAIKDIKSALNELYDMDENDYDLIDNKVQEIAKDVAQNVSSNLEYSERIKSFRDAVKAMPIKLDDSIKNDIPDFSSWAKKYFNRINFSKIGRAIDEYYQELAGAFPDFLDGDIINPADQIRSIADALDSSRSFKGDVNVDDIAYDVALRIYDDYYKHRAEDFNDASNEVNSDDRERFFDKGENPVRDIDIEYENEHGKNMRFTRTAAESGSLNDEQADSLRKQVESGRFTYNVINDADAVSKANDRLERSSVDRELSYLEGLLESKNLLSKDDIVLGERIIQEYAKAGDVDNLERAIAVVATAGTRAGQAVQAMRVLKKLSPEGQLMALQKQINIINTDMNLSGDKKVKLSPERVKDIKSSSSSKGLEQALERAKMELYDKVPSRWIDKWNAWRYLSMLGNPKTHIRNIIGNAIFVPVRELKNVIGASIENTVVKGEKSKAVGIVPKVFKEFAAKEFDENRRIIEAGGKENMERERRIFKSSILEGARKLNSWALESEDQFFLRSAYVRSFAGYLKANKVSPTLVKKLMSGKGTAIEIGDASISKIVDNAREYAMNEAQKATYRDYSAMANALNALKKKNAVTNVIGEGLMPFTKTPANILKRGVEYSPIGILKGIKELTHDVKKADEESRQRVILKGIDSMASGLSGSGILMLGMFLASQGILSGSGEEDKKLRDFDNMQGSQNYSINLGDFSYTIDWLAPVSLPLFVGVELFDSLNDGSWGGFTNIIDSMTAISEPMINMSMLQGINRAVTNYEPDKALTNLITDASVGYLSQGVPTVMGQVARTIDDSRRATYVDKNKDIPVFIQKALQQVMAKTPGVSKKLNPYRDSFGRVQGKDSVISRALENFVSPGYVKKKERDEVLDELERVYDSTDDKRVLPSAPSKSFGDMNLSASEYDKVSEIKGNTAYDVISSMMNNSAYSNLDDTEKAKAISYAYDYAVAKAKDESLGIEPDGWIAKAYNAAREGIDPDVYIAYNAYKNSFDDSVNDSEKNRKTREVLFEDESLSSSEKAVIDEYMFNDGMFIPKDIKVSYDSKEDFEISQTSNASQGKWKQVKGLGIELDSYMHVYEIYYQQGIKKREKIQMAIDYGLTPAQAYGMWDRLYKKKYN